MAETNPELDFELLPSVGDGLTNDERLDAAVARMDGVTEDIDVLEEPFVGLLAYGRSWSFDFSTDPPQFNRYGVGPVETTGLDTLKVWCEKVLRTYTETHVIYPSEIGVDPISIIGNQFDGAAMGELLESVREALLVHDRIERVEDMTVEQPTAADDYIIVTMTIVTDSDAFELTTEVAVS